MPLTAPFTKKVFHHIEINFQIMCIPHEMMNQQIRHIIVIQGHRLRRLRYNCLVQLIPIKMTLGEEKAWEILSGLSLKDVGMSASATCDETGGSYCVKSFGMDFVVSPRDRNISSNTPGSEILLDTLKDLFRLSLLSYLTSAKDIPFSGKLIRPVDVKGGQRFFTGTYELPLQEVAEKYGNSPEEFLRRGTELGAERTQFGDVSLRLYPLPRVPVSLILWLQDEEFPPRADLLFDSTVDLQISLSDVIWAIAMISLRLML